MIFKDKIVLITGGSSGIGAVTARLFAQSGAHIAITYKTNKRGAIDIVSEVQSYGVKAFAFRADLGKESQAKMVIGNVVKKFGKIDILVNNAGRYIDGDEWDKSSKTWLRSIEQNLVSVMNVSKYVVQVFQKQQHGIMVSIASVHGVYGKADAISYSAAKAGVINLTQSYADLLAGFGRANSISPSATNAGYWLTASKQEIRQTLSQRPNGKFVDPETVAKKILFLASDKASKITGKNFLIKK